jgi:hypothetical protein
MHGRDSYLFKVFADLSVLIYSLSLIRELDPHVSSHYHTTQQ